MTRALPQPMLAAPVSDPALLPGWAGEPKLWTALALSIVRGLELGTCSEDIVALEAREAAQADGRAPTVTAAPAAPDRPEPVDPQLPQVSHLTTHRLARPLPEDARPLPRLEQWDELLQLRRKDST